ncbi:MULTISPECIES: hypothetical protein [Natrialbaceae]|uniref:hypothetical protein n=1 Tax=Natrialbaceae TaxID=1644061 RepID=UPI00207C6D8A|nr:hypothetical protein [Natronococcus sp. CG52]
MAAYIEYNEIDLELMPVTGTGSMITMANEQPLWPDGPKVVMGQDASDAVLSGVRLVPPTAPNRKCNALLTVHFLPPIRSRLASILAFSTAIGIGRC